MVAPPGDTCVRFKDTGGSRDTCRDTHETDSTRTSQTNLKNPTHRLTRQTTPEPRDARPPLTHASPHTIHHSPNLRSSAVVVSAGDGDGDGARTWEQRGREPDGTSVTALTSAYHVHRAARRYKRLRHQPTGIGCLAPPVFSLGCF
jgi:hypothetical protein